MSTSQSPIVKRWLRHTFFITKAGIHIINRLLLIFEYPGSSVTAEHSTPATPEPSMPPSDLKSMQSTDPIPSANQPSSSNPTVQNMQPSPGPSRPYNLMVPGYTPSRPPTASLNDVLRPQKQQQPIAARPPSPASDATPKGPTTSRPSKLANINDGKSFGFEMRIRLLTHVKSSSVVVQAPAATPNAPVNDQSRQPPSSQHL
jgi:hypothetical protein